MEASLETASPLETLPSTSSRQAKPSRALFHAPRVWYSPLESFMPLSQPTLPRRSVKAFAHALGGCFFPAALSHASHSPSLNAPSPCKKALLSKRLASVLFSFLSFKSSFEKLNESTPGKNGELSAWMRREAFSLPSPIESMSRADPTSGSSERGAPRDMLNTGLSSASGRTSPGDSSAVNSRIMAFLYCSRSGTMTAILLPGLYTALIHLAARTTSSSSPWQFMIPASPAGGISAIPGQKAEAEPRRAQTPAMEDTAGGGSSKTPSITSLGI